MVEAQLAGKIDSRYPVFNTRKAELEQLLRELLALVYHTANIGR